MHHFQFGTRSFAGCRASRHCCGSRAMDCRRSHMQVGAADGLTIVVQSTACAPVPAAGPGRRLMQPSSSQLSQVIAGTVASGASSAAISPAQLLSGAVNGAVDTQAAKADLLGAAVTTPGYDAAAGALQMTVQTEEIDGVAAPPRNAPPPRWDVAAAGHVASHGWFLFRPLHAPIARPAICPAAAAAGNPSHAHHRRNALRCQRCRGPPSTTYPAASPLAPSPAAPV